MTVAHAGGTMGGVGGRPTTPDRHRPGGGEGTQTNGTAAETGCWPALWRLKEEDLTHAQDVWEASTSVLVPR